MSKFRATGQGYQNAAPNVPANQKTGNGLLKNTGLTPGDRNQKLWLYVVGVSSSWSLQGSTSQSQGRASFNPQHMTQDKLIVRGVVPNQFEYDRLVEFIATHHEVATSTHGGVMSALDKVTNQGGKPISFQLVPYSTIYWTTPPNEDLPSTVVENLSVGKGRYQLSPMHIEGYVNEIRAGHARFINAPVFEMAITVSNDFLDPDVEGIASLDNSHWWNMFGPFYKVTNEGLPSTGERVVSDISDGLADFQQGDYRGAVSEFADAAQGVWQALADGLRND